MGFELPQRTALLKFEGEYEGAEVECRLDVPIGLAMRFSSLSVEDGAAVMAAVEDFAEHVLIAWNLTRAGEPVPPTKQGISAQPFGFVAAVLANWSEAAMAAPKDSSGPSLNGSTSKAATGPTAPV